MNSTRLHYSRENWSTTAAETKNEEEEEEEEDNALDLKTRMWTWTCIQTDT